MKKDYSHAYIIKKKKKKKKKNYTTKKFLPEYFRLLSDTVDRKAA